MNDFERDYKAKRPFWKWKRAERTGNSRRPLGGENPFWSSWGGSLLIHLFALLLILSAVQFHRPEQKGVRGRTDGSVGILFFDEEKVPEPNTDNGGPGEEKTQDQNSEPVSGEKQEEITKPEPEEETIGIIEKKESAAVTHISFQTPQTEDSGTGEAVLPQSESPSKRSGSGQTVGFGKLNGKGKRFVYVLDRSESMKTPERLPIEYAVREACASIQSLDPKEGAQKFQVVIYNHNPAVFKNRKRLLDVTETNKEEVIRYLQETEPEGGTDPLAALDTAIRMAPDVIFFLTDAEEEISPMVLAKIRGICRQGGVSQIHVIEFGKPNGKRLKSFQKLASQNNGTYIYEDLAKFKE